MTDPRPINQKSPFVIALPKGRVWPEALALLKKTGLALPPDLFSGERRRLVTTLPIPAGWGDMAMDFSNLTLIEVKNGDVFSFVASGGAVAGIVGRDIWEEKLRDEGEDLRDYRNNVYVPLDVKIGPCRLSVARPVAAKDNSAAKDSAVKKIVASKYPNLTRAHYGGKGQAIEVLPLLGSLELAPVLGLADEIVDLVATGQTLKDNNLVEVEKILDITSLLIVNRVAYKTNPRGFAEFLTAVKKIIV